MSFTLVAPVPLVETTTVLPNPKFGDSEATTGELNILRTVNGRRRTYVKSKNRRKLQWDFDLTRNKAMELFEFYRSYNSQKVFVKDHNDRRWEGFIVNNPLEIEMARRGLPTLQGWPVGETCSVTIEFEGTRTEDDLRGAKIFTPQALSQVGPGLDQDVFIDTPLQTFGALVHNWDAFQIVHPNNTRLFTWPDIGPGNNDLIATVGGGFDPAIDRSPTYRQASAIFGSRPTVAFETVHSSLTSQIAAMHTTSNTSLFSSRRGTIFWVLAHTVNVNWPAYINTLDPSIADSISEQSRDAFLQTALDDTSFNTEVEYGVWALENTTGSPDVEQIHISGSSNPLMPINVRFQPADPANELRLATTGIDSVPSLQPVIYTLSRDSDTTLRFRTNGVEREGVTILDMPGYTGIFHVNDQKFVPEFDTRIRGEWGQLLTYSKALKTSELEEVEKFLSLRWGIPLLTVPF